MDLNKLIKEVEFKTMAKNISKAKFVLEVYPNAKPIKVKKHIEIWSGSTYLGQGKSKKQAWASAYNQNINI